MWPPPSNSDQQDYYIFSRGFLSTFIYHCYWRGPHSKYTCEINKAPFTFVCLMGNTCIHLYGGSSSLICLPVGKYAPLQDGTLLVINRVIKIVLSTGSWGYNPYKWSFKPTYNWYGPTLYQQKV